MKSINIAREFILNYQVNIAMGHPFSLKISACTGLCLLVCSFAFMGQGPLHGILSHLRSCVHMNFGNLVIVYGTIKLERFLQGRDFSLHFQQKNNFEKASTLHFHLHVYYFFEINITYWVKSNKSVFTHFCKLQWLVSFLYMPTAKHSLWRVSKSELVNYFYKCWISPKGPICLISRHV